MSILFFDKKKEVIRNAIPCNVPQRLDTKNYTPFLKKSVSFPTLVAMVPVDPTPNPLAPNLSVFVDRAMLIHQLVCDKSIPVLVELYATL